MKHAVFHHALHIRGGAYVGKRIAVDNDQVSQFARLEGTEILVEGVGLGREPGRRFQRLPGLQECRAGSRSQRAWSRHRAKRWPRLILRRPGALRRFVDLLWWL